MGVCTQCGEENTDRARFCSACGESLAAPPSAGEERKVVSVLFVDLVGFTARSDQADPEDVRATLRPYHARLKEEIERFGGTVEKFVGDAVMAVFGAPVAHEDDAERAVRSALRITEAIEEMNEERQGLELAVRAAVNTGEAVAALSARPERGEGIVTGDVVNTASRLQQIAPVGGVVVGEVSYRTTRGVIDYEELAPVAVKGKLEPVLVWRAVAARSRFGVDVEQRTQVPLIGRDHETAILRQLYERAIRESTVQLVTISGEPGVGKTRLVWEFQAFVDAQPELVFWRQGRCLPYGEGITFWALGEIVKAHAGILENDAQEVASAKLAQAVGNVVEDPGERDWIRARLAPLVGAGTDGAGTVEREESFTAWRSFLEAVAAQRPFTLVFEDLHWADQAMLAFVEHLVDWASGVSMLVLCTARPELYERQPGWGGGKRNSTTIALSPLSGEETARLIAGLLDQAVLPAETQTAILERAGGNPLYAEEFVRMLIDGGVLVRRGASWALAPDREIPVPESVQALIAARLDTLPPERKALLHDAAVVGKVFWSGALAAMGGVDDATVREGLHELARKELLRPARRASVEGEAEYAFWHLLIRDVAYGQIPRSARAAKHRAAAEWIERIAGERVEDHAELLAYHNEQALELARAAGDEPAASELEGAARRFLRLAGDRAFQLDMARAGHYYRRALDLSPPGSPGRAEILAGLANVGWLRSDPPADFLAMFEEAIAEFRAQGDVRGAGGTMADLSRSLWSLGETARSREVLAEAVELLEGEPPSPELARAYNRAAGDRMLASDPSACLAWCEKAFPLVERFGLESTECRLLDLRGISRCELGDLEGGLQDMRESLRRCLELGLGFETGVSYNNLGDWVWMSEGPGEGLEVHRTGIEFAERRGIAGQVLWTRAETTWLLFDLGDWDELLRVADAVVSRTEGGHQTRVMVATMKAWALAYRGMAEDAAALAHEYVPRAREIGDPQILIPALTAAAWAEFSRGKLDAAVALVHELEEATREHLDWRPGTLLECLRILVAAGSIEEARRYLGSAEPRAPRDQHDILAGHAILEEAAGELGAAIELFEEAAAAWGEFGHPLERGQALLGGGRCLLTTGSVHESELKLREAREVFSGLGARPLVAETDDLLARASALSS
ncbi:MAG: AAA family ATPase [Actinobacteria bacterium]|nr:AAA family ATPase [Actinomycetota bacterium]